MKKKKKNSKIHTCRYWEHELITLCELAGIRMLNWFYFMQHRRKKNRNKKKSSRMSSKIIYYTDWQKKQKNNITQKMDYKDGTWKNKHDDTDYKFL